MTEQGEKRKKTVSETSDSDESTSNPEIVPDKCSLHESKNAYLGDLGNTMDESSDTQSDENAGKRKIILKFRKKLRKIKSHDSSQSVYNVTNDDIHLVEAPKSLENDLDDFYQNPLGDPLVQELMFKEEM